jgi:hypothetical protein
MQQAQRAGWKPALRDPAALVSVVMSLRRGSTLVGFAGGLLLFGEKTDCKNFPP